MLHILNIYRQFILIFALLLIFISLSFGRANVNNTETSLFTIINLEESLPSLRNYYTEAEVVIVFFVNIDLETSDSGRQLVNEIKTKCQENWNKIRTKILIVVNGDSNIVRSVLNENNKKISITEAPRSGVFPEMGVIRGVVRGIQQIDFVIENKGSDVFRRCGANTLYTLYVIEVSNEAGKIIARFDAPEDIRSSKVDLAVKSCVLSDYLIKASFDDMHSNNVFKKSTGESFDSSDITIREEIRNEISYGFSTERFVGKDGESIWINFRGRGEGDFNINLPGPNLRDAKYLSMWVLGDEGGEKFDIILRDGNGTERELSIDRYIEVQKNLWQRISIPLSDFDLDSSSIAGISLIFNVKFREKIYMDEIIFFRDRNLESVIPAYGNYKVVIYSKIKNDLFYIQPWIIDPYTDIMKDGSWSVNIHLGNETYTVYLVQMKSPIFSINANLENDLTVGGQISENLRKVFIGHNIQLPQDACISSPNDLVKRNNRWGITCSQNKVALYLIRKEGNMINVYNAWPTNIENLPQNVDGVEILDMDQVPPRVQTDKF